MFESGRAVLRSYLFSLKKTKLLPSVKSNFHLQIKWQLNKGDPFAYSRLLTLQHLTLSAALWAWLSFCSPSPSSSLRVQMGSSSQVLSTHHTFQEGSTLHRLLYLVKRSCWWKSLCISLRQLWVYCEWKPPTENVLRNRSSSKLLFFTYTWNGQGCAIAQVSTWGRAQA